eukprot:gene18596-25108_t
MGFSKPLAANPSLVEDDADATPAQQTPDQSPSTMVATMAVTPSPGATSVVARSSDADSKQAPDQRSSGAEGVEEDGTSHEGVKEDEAAQLPDGQSRIESQMHCNPAYVDQVAESSKRGAGLSAPPPAGDAGVNSAGGVGMAEKQGGGEAEELKAKVFFLEEQLSALSYKFAMAAHAAQDVEQMRSEISREGEKNTVDMRMFLEEQLSALSYKFAMAAHAAQDVEQMRSEISKMEAQMRERDTEVAKLGVAGSGKDAELAKVAESLGEKDAELAKVAEALGKKDAELVTLTEALGERDAELANVAEALGTQNAELSQLGVMLIVKEEECTRISAQVDALNEAQNKSTVLVEAAEGRNMALMEELQKMRENEGTVLVEAAGERNVALAEELQKMRENESTVLVEAAGEQNMALAEELQKMLESAAEEQNMELVKELQKMGEVNVKLTQQKVELVYDIEQLKVLVDESKAESKKAVDDSLAVISSAHAASMKIQEMEARCMVLQSAKAPADSAANDLKIKLIETVSMLEDERRNVELQKKELELSEKRYTELERVLEEAKQFCNIALDAQDAARHEVVVMREHNEILQHEISSLKDENTSLRRIVDGVEVKLVKFQNNEDEVFALVRDSQTAEEGMRADRDRCVADLDKLRSEHNEAQHKMKLEIQGLQDSLAKAKLEVGQVEAVQACLAKATLEAEEAEKVKVELMEEVGNLEDALTTTKDALATTKDALATTKDDLVVTLESESRISLMSLVAMEQIQARDKELEEVAEQLAILTTTIEAVADERQRETENYESQLIQLKTWGSQAEAGLQDASVDAQNARLDARNARLEVESLSSQLSQVARALHEGDLRQEIASMVSSFKQVAETESQLIAKEELLELWKQEAQAIGKNLEAALKNHKQELEERAAVQVAQVVKDNLHATSSSFSQASSRAQPYLSQTGAGAAVQVAQVVKYSLHTTSSSFSQVCSRTLPYAHITNRCCSTGFSGGEVQLAHHVIVLLTGLLSHPAICPYHKQVLQYRLLRW